jgi:hypothetical protein
MEDFENLYINNVPDPLKANFTQITYNFGLLPAGENMQYSPIIYENYMAFTSYGDIDILPPGNLNVTEPCLCNNFLPLYMNNDQKSQIFFSEATLNQILLYAQL